ncbi:MAG: HAMP domain-containing protein [Anaerolineae bacterium]|nr:HAMP domain-containing protein [Anaerolineae bacterium]
MIQYREHRERTLREAERNLVNVGQLIGGSLEHAMLTQDHTELQNIMDSVARLNDVRFMVLLNRRSEIRFAPGSRDIGKRLDLADPGCQVCHRSGETTLGGTVNWLTNDGEAVLRNCTPIVNRPECYRCHSPQTPINGALITDFSMAETNEHLNLELRYNLLGGLGIVLIVAIIMNLLLDRMVLRRLDQLMGTVRDFGIGNLSLRVPARGTDEISRLDAAFNDMARSLEVKEQETGRLYRELQQKEVARAQLLQQIIQVQEEERKRIARDLHDDFAQTLTALTIGLETVLQALPDSMAVLGRQLSRVQELTMTTLGQTHRWIQDLRPRVLDDLGLVPAIR